MTPNIARQKMIQQQVRTWNVSDQKVLTTLGALQRHQFAPAKYAGQAYAETRIPIGNGQFMMTPMLEGRILQTLRLQPTDSVMEIGTGTGFLAACLAQLAATVTSIDIYDDFVEQALSNLQKNNINNVSVECMDASVSLPDRTFDAIAVSVSMPTVDERIIQALNPGGRLFVVVGSAPIMTAKLITARSSTDWETADLFESQLEPLIDASKTQPFSF